MAPSLDSLKKKKQALLKKAGMRNANLESLRAREAEKRKLKAEIYALEHPESARARRVLRSAVVSFGRSVRTRANIVADNAVRIQKQKNEMARREREKVRELEMARLKAARRRSPAKKKSPVRKRVRKRKSSKRK